MSFSNLDTTFFFAFSGMSFMCDKVQRIIRKQIMQFTSLRTLLKCLCRLRCQCMSSRR